MIPVHRRPAIRATLRKAGFRVYFGMSVNYWWPKGKPEFENAGNDWDLKHFLQGLSKC